MAPAASQYTLVGFSPDLDWRCLSFLKPIPANRVCSTCGLVRKRTALLSCTHVLCESCYGQCVQEEVHVCPLDGQEWHSGDDILWRELPVDQLLRRKVRCLNAESGCQHVAAASKIILHFQQQCLHHSVCCPKCLVIIRCSEVCAHLRSGSCGSSNDPPTDLSRQSGLKDQSAYFADFREAFEQQAGEIKGHLERIALDISTQGDSLHEMSHDMNTLKETLRQELIAEVQNPENFKGTLRRLSTSNGEIRECLNTRSDAIKKLSTVMNRLEKLVKCQFGNLKTETAGNLANIIAALEDARTRETHNIQTALERITKVVQFVQLQTTRCEFLVPGVESLEEKALMQGQAYFDNERVYLRGYCMSPGLEFRKTGDSVCVHGCLTLHKGDMDDVVLWPFEQRIKLSIVHPEIGAEREIEVKTSRSRKYYQKPQNSSNAGVWFKESFVLANLWSDGFVEEDKLRVKWELMP